MNEKTKTMKKLFLLLLLTTFAGFGQQVGISGVITDDLNDEPMPGASIYINEIQKGTTTDIDGKYQIYVTPGTYTLVASYIGFTNAIETVQAKKDTQVNFALKTTTYYMKEVVVTAVRADNDTPVAQTNISKKKLQEKNLGQDVPFLLDQTPSVVTTSDAGAGIGYTGIRIRGISSQQINVTLNGIPLNDPESHGVYWVDIPDFAASTSSLQIQRGVGTSTFGTGAFGASISLETDKINTNAYAQANTSYGSFNTQKYSLKGSTGILNNHFEFTGRFSKITSDGYVDRASSDLSSYYVSGSYKDNKNTVKAIAFGGAEITYQAWNGINKSDFENNPTFNSAGAIYNNNWEVTGYYDNEVDNYKQDHYQLHFNHKIADNLSFNLAAHYTYGRGYYEQYKQDRNFSDYGLTPIITNGSTIDHTDLIRRKWLDNDFYGLVGSANYQTGKMKMILGLAINEYDGRHFGQIIWAQYASNSKIKHEYYRNLGVKNTVNAFIKNIYNLNDKLKLYTDIQFRKIDYKVNGTLDWQYPWNTKDNLFFINPKLGLHYDLNTQQSIYLSVAQTHREPNRDDYVNSEANKPKPETLNDIEAGWKFKKHNFSVETNLFAMYYKDQLVLSGKIDNVGNPIRENVGKSHRLGIETQVGYAFSKQLSINANVTYSDNRNQNYFTIDGNNLINFGKTKLTYSPNIIAGGAINYKPLKGLKLQMISKYVGDQYMDNRNIDASKLEAYFIENAFISYKLPIKKAFKNIEMRLQINNLFNKKYASNGYMWGDDPYYYSQAGRNFLLGLTADF